MTNSKLHCYLLTLFLTAVAGCGKKQQSQESAAPAEAPAAAPATQPTPGKEPAAPVQANEKLPGAAVVKQDIKNKNYDKAVEGLLVLRGYASVHNELWTDYRELSGEVGQSLVEAAQKDDNAKRALAAYNAAMIGR